MTAAVLNYVKATLLTTPPSSLPDRDLGTQAVTRQEFEGTVQGQLLGVVCRGPPPDYDPAVILFDGQAPDAVVSRLTDPRLHLFGDGHHRRTSVEMVR